MKKTDGFTLVELMVGIVCSALVTGAIITFMLMGVKTTRSVIDANADQRNAKIVITMMENLASEGSIGSVEYVDDDPSINRDWTIFDQTPSPLLSYSTSSQSLRGRNGSVLMEGVLASSVVAETKNNGVLLKFSITTNLETYTTSVLCRTSNIVSESLARTEIEQEFESKLEASLEATADSRLVFLQRLVSQYGSTGKIDGDGDPYSLWYNGDAYPSGWNENTPWCACFLSWGLSEISGKLNDVPKYANVNEFWAHFQRNNANNADYNFAPGDLIFFDWNNDDSLDHVGAVLYTNGTWVYTIEGNSGNRVALRRYALDDTSIYGYGVLNWKTT